MSTDLFSSVAFPRLGPDSGKAAHDTACARGHAAGYADGLALARAELAEQSARLDAGNAAARAQADALLAQRLHVLDTAARALEVRTAPVLAEARARILAASLAITEELLGRALEDGPASARAAVDRALGAVPGEDVHTVRLHPADLAVLTTDGISRPGVQLVGDPLLARGDAIAECPNGHIDARLGSALARVRAALTAGGGS